MNRRAGIRCSLMALPHALVAGLILLGCKPPDPVIVLERPVLDSMNAIFLRSNEHWDELADLTQMEKMLGTIRPTQREFLGCLLGGHSGDTVWARAWIPARNMKQLQFAVTGDCDGIPDMIGTFHTHPYRADTLNRAIKEPVLAPQDLKTFASSSDLISLVIWDTDSIDAALRAIDGHLVHPARVVIH